MKRTRLELAPPAIEALIIELRGHKVILDADLARIYGVPVKRLNEQVKRNANRFPSDFVFRLTPDEVKACLPSRSQIATLKRGQNIKYAPFAFHVKEDSVPYRVKRKLVRL